MNQRILLLAASIMLVSNAADAQATALIDGTLVDGTGGPAVANAVVIVTGDRITCVGAVAQCPVPSRAARVDITSRFITPGLVDAHVHFSQTGCVDGG